MTGLLVGLLGAIGGFGLVLLGSAWTASPERQGLPGWLSRVDREALMIRAVAGLVGGLVVLVLTGWLVATVVGGVAGWQLAGMWRRRGRSAKDEQARIEALAVWCEQLRDLLSAEHGLIGTVEATVPTCPSALRGEVSRLATGLGRRRPEHAIRQFAVEVDDPSGDLVASVLLLALSRSGRTAELLSELAATIRSRTEMRLRVEADRAGQRSEARFIIGFSVAVIAGVVIFGRGTDFLDPYKTVTGELVLLLVAVLFAVGIVWMTRLTRFERPARFLSVGEDFG